MSIRMRHTKGKTRRRRSSHPGVDSPRLSTCVECGAQHLRHRVCMECGTYRGRKIIDVEALREKKMERIKRKRREMGLEPEPEKEE